MSERRIVIVGGGFCGALVAIHLLRTGGVRLHITIVEATRRPVGAGVAYATQDAAHVLNVPAGRMSAFVDDADHFYRFALARDPSVTRASFVRRSLYGEYVAACLASAERTSRHRLVCMQGEVTSLARSSRNDRHDVTLASGDQVAADAVVLAIGAPRPRHPWAADAGTRLRSPWQAGALEDIPRGANILIVGTGLTMVDVTLAVARDPTTSIRAISRHGLLPRTHAPGVTARSAPDLADACTVRELLRRVRRELEAADRTGDDWRSVIDALRPVTPQVWTRLAPAEQRRFLRHVRPLWETHRHRIPPASAAMLQALAEARRFAVEAGRIRDVTSSGDGPLDVAVDLRRGGHAHVRADVLFDCTGPATSATRTSSPIVDALVARGLAAPDHAGLGLRAGESGELVNADGRPTAIFAVGPLVRGLAYEATAVPELRVRALRSAHAVVARLTTERRDEPRRRFRRDVVPA